MKYVALFGIILLSGCMTTIPKFPDAPKLATESCIKLDIVNSDVKLSELIETVNQNYTKYHICSAKVETWIEWYEKQRKIYEEIKK